MDQFILMLTASALQRDVTVSLVTVLQQTNVYQIVSILV